MNWRSNRKNNKAYLLIELMIVVVILGLTILFIAQAFSSSLFAVRKAFAYSKALLLAERVVWDNRLELALLKSLAREDFPKSFRTIENNINFQVKEDALETGFLNLGEIVFDVAWKDAKVRGEFEISAFMPMSAAK